MGNPAYGQLLERVMNLMMQGEYTGSIIRALLLSLPIAFLGFVFLFWWFCVLGILFWFVDRIAASTSKNRHGGVEVRFGSVPHR